MLCLLLRVRRLSTVADAFFFFSFLISVTCLSYNREICRSSFQPCNSLGLLNQLSTFLLCVPLPPKKKKNGSLLQYFVATINVCVSCARACMCQCVCVCVCVSELLHFYTLSRTLRSSSDIRILKIQQYKRKTRGFFAPSLALGTTFGIHSHKTFIDTVQPYHLLTHLLSRSHIWNRAFM